MVEKIWVGGLIDALQKGFEIEQGEDSYWAGEEPVHACECVSEKVRMSDRADLHQLPWERPVCFLNDVATGPLCPRESSFVALRPIYTPTGCVCMHLFTTE